MILIVTHKTDFSADYVVNILNKRGLDYRRLNCEDLLVADLRIGLDPAFSFSLLGERHYDSVWFRRTKLPDLASLPPPQRNYVLSETDSLLKNVFATLEAKWLSPPLFVYEAENKLLQLKAAVKVGFDIPETLITNSKDDVMAFYRLHNGEVIVKPLSQTRISDVYGDSFIFTNKLSSDVYDRIDELDLTPCIIQRYIPKEYELRVTVVDDKVFPAKVESQKCDATKIDWRRERLPFEPVELPSRLSDLCIELLQKLRFSFGAIDLVRTPAGEYVFLEVNPNGQWVWIETQTSLKISDAMVEYLTDVQN